MVTNYPFQLIDSPGIFHGGLPRSIVDYIGKNSTRLISRSAFYCRMIVHLDDWFYLIPRYFRPAASILRYYYSHWRCRASTIRQLTSRALKSMHSERKELLLLDRAIDDRYIINERTYRGTFRRNDVHASAANGTFIRERSIRVPRRSNIERAMHIFTRASCGDGDAIRVIAARQAARYLSTHKRAPLPPLKGPGMPDTISITGGS